MCTMLKTPTHRVHNNRQMAAGHKCYSAINLEAVLADRVTALFSPTELREGGQSPLRDVESGTGRSVSIHEPNADGF